MPRDSLPGDSLPGDSLPGDRLADIPARDVAGLGLHGIDIDAGLLCIASRERRRDLGCLGASQLLDVLGHHPATGACSAHRCKVDAELRGHAPGIRGDEMAAGRNIRADGRKTA